MVIEYDDVAHTWVIYDRDDTTSLWAGFESYEDALQFLTFHFGK